LLFLNQFYYIQGSKRCASHIDVYNRRSDRSEWDKSWTSGEQFFSEICHGIGINCFGLGTGLRAQLIDVGHSDGLADIATEVQRILIRKRCKKVSKVSIVLPSEPTLKDNVAPGTVRKIFGNVWSAQEPKILREAAIKFTIRGNTQGAID